MDLGVGNLMMGLSAVVAGWAGIRGLNAWRAETVGRRKTELAEEVLAQFYRARDVLTWVRFPASGDDDGTADLRAGSAPMMTSLKRARSSPLSTG